MAGTHDEARSREAELRAQIAAERLALADVLDGLAAAQWDEPSLCEGWRVRDVVAHITMPFRLSRWQFVLGLVRAGGRFNHMADVVARRDGARPTSELTAAVRSNANHPWKPPGGGYEGALTHDVIHTLDITRALDLDRSPPPEVLSTVLDSATGARSLKFFGTDIEGVSLQATDVDWTFGAGDPLVGSGVDLVLWLTGRPVAANALTGRAAVRAAARRPLP